MISLVPKSSKIATTMRKIGFIAALVVAMTAVSCVQEMNTESPAPETSTVTFDATFDASATKAVLVLPEEGTTKAKVEWEANDQVSILVGEGKYLYTAAQAGATTTLTTEAEDVPAEGTYYAVFPYDEAATISGEDVITTTLPAEQTAVLESFTTHLAVAQTTDTKLAFKNVCGLVKVNIDAENVTKIVFQGNSDEIVAGGINVTVSDAPSWTAADGQGATSVTLLPAKDQTSLAKGDYYFAVLPQTFAAGFKVTAYKGAESWVIRNVMASTEIKRAGVVAGKSFFEIEGNGTEASPYILKTPQDMVNMRTLATLGGETWFKMANNIDMEGVTNYVPVNYDQNYERKIHFDGGNFTISKFSYDKSVNGANYGSLFGVLYGSCRNLKVDKATIVATNGCGVIGGYVGTTGKPAVVENVTITNSSVTNSGDRCGGICGTAKEATFNNVSFHGTVVSTFPYTDDLDGARSGGFVGLTQTSATFTNCSADVTLEGANTNLGGFVGKITGEASFVDCDAKSEVVTTATTKHRAGCFAGYVNGTIVKFDNCEVLEGSVIEEASGAQNAIVSSIGGFAGYVGSTVKTTVENSSANVTVNAPYGQNVGGFIGIFGGGELVVSDSHTKGSVTGNNQVGGFVAYLESGAGSLTATSSYSEAKITGSGHYVAGFGGNFANSAESSIKLTDCYASGDVTSTGSSCSAFIGVINSNGELTRCYATGNLTAANNVGGVLGYLTTGTVTLTDCHYDGETITASASAGGIVGTINTGASAVLEGCYSSGELVAKSSHISGIMGAASGTSHTFRDCYTTMNVYTSGGVNVGAIVGSGVGSINMTDCYGECNVESDYVTKNDGRVGGLVGRHRDEMTMLGCHYKGTVKGNYYVGGLIGYCEGKEASIQKCYSEGTVISYNDNQGVGRYHGGMIGACSGANSKLTIEDSYSAINVYGEQFVGGLIGSFEGAKGLAVQNCYTNGSVKGRGVGGIVGRVTQTSTIANCVVWDEAITSTRTGGTQYASGPITGSVTFAGNFAACYRNPSMVYTDAFVPAVDHEDVSNALPAAPAVGTIDGNQYAYHGKVTTETTISGAVKAHDLGWSTEIWDFSGDVPVLK